VTDSRVDDLGAGDVTRRLEEGHQTFLGIDLLCGPGALVPRPETELLGRMAIEKVTAAGASPRVIDVCCGAGNLGCAIATRVPGARVWMTDLTDGCVGWARRNVEHLGLGDRVTVRQGDLFAGLADAGPGGSSLDGTIDVIVCNPPYISSGRLAGDRASLLDHEPREAFDGGPYGLTIHQRVLKEALPLLKPGGWLLFEIGEGQHRQITLLFQRARAYEAIDLAQNAAGTPRVAFGRVKAATA
jgi:release factor glutamine methyltransferase